MNMRLTAAKRVTAKGVLPRKLLQLRARELLQARATLQLRPVIWQTDVDEDRWRLQVVARLGSSIRVLPTADEERATPRATKPAMIGKRWIFSLEGSKRCVRVTSYQMMVW